MNLFAQAAAKSSGKVLRHPAVQGSSALLRWLLRLGGLGLFCVAIVDSSVIPLPLPGSTDLLLLLLASHRGTTVALAAWLALCAFAGSMLGGYLTWGAGRKGGEVALSKRVPARFMGRLKGWVEQHGGLSVGFAAVMPPPIPLTPVLLAAGALGVPRGRFLWAYGAGRAVRYGLLAWLGVTYGRHVVSLWRKTLAGWSVPILWAYAGLVVLGIGFGVWKVYAKSQARWASGCWIRGLLAETWVCGFRRLGRTRRRTGGEDSAGEEAGQDDGRNRTEADEVTPGKHVCQATRWA